jgi:hypothetical protein
VSALIANVLRGTLPSALSFTNALLDRVLAEFSFTTSEMIESENDDKDVQCHGRRRNNNG